MKDSSQKRVPELRIPVVAVDILLRLTEAQLKTWLYYKRREGVDRKAWGKARSIGEATGLVAGTIKNARSWLVKHGWLKRNGYSASGLPMFLAVIGKLPQVSFENDGGISELTEGSFENDRRDNSEMTGASFSNDTEVPTLKHLPLKHQPEAPTQQNRVSESVSEQGAPASPSHDDVGDVRDPFFSLKVGRLLTKKEQSLAFGLFIELFPGAEWDKAKAVELFDAVYPMEYNAIRGFWLWNKSHKSGGLRFHTIRQLADAFASVSENSAWAQYTAHDYRDCPVCLKATFGLLAVIWGCSRVRANSVPFAVGAYITAAYWFTSSTSFANPAVTIARGVSDTFAGIRPVDVPFFIAAQMCGAVAATVLIRWLIPSLPKTAENILLPHEASDHLKTYLFACVHNAGRSQMAAALFNLYADRSGCLAISAGTQPADHVHPEVVEVMREIGVDLSSARPQRLTNDLARTASVLVTMGCGEACPFVPGLRIIDWALADPKGQSLQAVRAIRDEIHDRVKELIHSECAECCKAAC